MRMKPIKSKAAVLEQIEFHAGMLSELRHYIDAVCHVGEGGYGDENNHELARELNNWLERQAPAILGLCKLEAKVVQLRRVLWMFLDLKITQVLGSSRFARSRSFAQWRIAHADRVLKVPALAPLRWDDVLEEGQNEAEAEASYE
jgi:hypothetical protein